MLGPNELRCQHRKWPGEVVSVIANGATQRGTLLSGIEIKCYS